MTNATNVYEMQQKLDRLGDEMNAIYLNTHPEQRHLLVDSSLQHEITALCIQVSAAQEEIGGAVYRIHNGNLDTFTEKLEKLNKKAAKYNLDPVSYTVTDEHDEHIVQEHGRVVSVDRFTFVVIKAGKVQIAGWQFVARLDVEEAGVLISKVPAMALVSWDASAEQKADAQAHLDAITLQHLAKPETAQDCDHCGLDRRRKSTFVLENVETGEFKQVGSTCLRDFLGVDPGRLAQYAEWLSELATDLDDEDGLGGFSTGNGGTPTYWYLANVCTMLRTNGWSSRSASSYATADQAADNVYYQAKGQRDKTGKPMWVDTTEEDIERAKEAIEWGKEFLGEKVQSGNASDFDYNLCIAAQATVVTKNIKGTLAYLPVAHAKWQEKEIEKRAEREARKDEFFGQVGDRVTLTLKVFSVFESDGYYGVSYITTLRDSEGRPFKWFGSYDLERGETYTATWTIKKHEEHATYGKSTVLTRPSKLTKVETEEVA